MRGGKNPRRGDLTTSTERFSFQVTGGNMFRMFPWIMRIDELRSLLSGSAAMRVAPLKKLPKKQKAISNRATTRATGSGQ